MTVLQITCDNCGAKYKLPESFTGTQAKCQKCHSIIDVAKQRAAAAGGTSEAAKPATAAKPAAAAKPAVDRSKAAAPASKPAAPAKAAAPSKATAGKTPARGKAAAGDDDDRGIIKPKKASMMPLYLSAAGLLVIAIVVVVMLTRGGDKPKTDTTAKAPDATKPAEKPTDAAAKAADPAAKPADAPAPTPTPVAKPAKSNDPLDPNGGGDAPADATPSAPKASDAKPADAAASEAPKEPAPSASGAAKDEIVLPTGQKIVVRDPPASLDKVTDPKTYPEVAWPPSITDEAKAEARDLVETAATNDGVQGLRAIRKLESLGHPAVFAIVERLRLLDYKSIEGSQPANTLNRALQNITKSFAGYVEVRLDWEMTPAIAEFNTRTVKKWIDSLAKFQTAADLQKVVDANKAKNTTPDDDK